MTASARRGVWAATPNVYVAKAREDAGAFRSKTKAGTDVLADKREALAKAKREMTFEVVAKLAHWARKWFAGKTNAVWLARLEQNSFPQFHKALLHDVDALMIIRAQERIKHEKPETVRRAHRAILSLLSRDRVDIRRRHCYRFFLWILSGFAIGSDLYMGCPPSEDPCL